jgi:predicted DNA repair protein MutK
LVALERDKITGAVRTDFVLSAEIIAITLGTVQTSPWMTQLTVLSGIALIMTIGVYGIVAGIVKIDDAGLYLSRLKGEGASALRALGRGLLVTAPWLMKALSVVGTAAMFMVGGGILLHGLPWLHPIVEAISVPLLPDLLVGVAAGALALVLVIGWQKVTAIFKPN